MIDGNFLSTLSMVNWRALLQWYIDHLNTAPLIQTLQQGEALSNHDWYTLMVLYINIIVLFFLIRLFVRVHQKSMFKAWLQDKRSLLQNRLKPPSRTKSEAKVLGSNYLKQTYNLHRFAMYGPALEKYKLALQAAPHDLNTYLVGIKIISEMDEPNKKFIQLLLTHIGKLRSKNPAVWQEVTKYGREKAPDITQWGTIAS